MELRQGYLAGFSVTKCSILRLVVIVLAWTFCSFEMQGASRGDHLNAGGVLSGDSVDYLQSGDGRYRLVMQADCNLVLYKNHHVIWTPHTNGRGSHCQAIMQGDGNFVVYSFGGGRKTALWDSKTNGHGGSHVIAQNDGNLVVYQNRTALWNSNTKVPEPNSRPVDGHPATLNPGESLLGGRNDYLQAPHYTLRMQADCNLVLYYDERVALWASNTQGKDTECTAIMQPDGNLVVYNGGGWPVWDSHTKGRNGASLQLQNDGNAVIYFGDGQVAWSSAASAAAASGRTAPGTRDNGPCTTGNAQPCIPPPPCNPGTQCPGGQPPGLPPGSISGSSRPPNR